MAKNIVWEETCWNGRKVVLHKTTLLNHVARFHYDELFIVDALKRNLSAPICVIENRNHGTENAVFVIPVGGHKWLLVAVKFQGIAGKIARKPNFIKTFYGVNKIPTGKLLWGKLP